jgi:hypothetical protein
MNRRARCLPPDNRVLRHRPQGRGVSPYMRFLPKSPIHPAVAALSRPMIAPVMQLRAGWLIIQGQ